jgi:hypothetical protein
MYPVFGSGDCMVAVGICDGSDDSLNIAARIALI